MKLVAVLGFLALRLCAADLSPFAYDQRPLDRTWLAV